MSIPIAARRYISEHSLSSLNWQKKKGLIIDLHGVRAILVCERNKKFRMVVGQYFLGSWHSVADDCFDKIHNVVCWSEIKI